VKNLEYLASRNTGRFDVLDADGPKTTFRLTLDGGETGLLEDWALFDGVNLTFNDVPRGTLAWQCGEPRTLQFEWSQRGRGEIACANGKSYFVHEGQCAVHDQRIVKRQMRYPMPRYLGFTLSVEYEAGSAALKAQPATRHLDFNALRERFAGEEGCRVFLPDRGVASLFSSFFEVDERARLERLRLKALELLVLLDATDRPAWMTFPYHTRDHAAALERAVDLLGSSLDDDLALGDVARCADMGLSLFKERFRAAYGLSPMAYRRQCRIEEAARRLERTDDSVAHIAAQVGYRNPSKFAAAFAEVIGQAPSAYRTDRR
jgi:AraC-like DNA-binding protein